MTVRGSVPARDRPLCRLAIELRCGRPCRYIPPNIAIGDPQSLANLPLCSRASPGPHSLYSNRYSEPDRVTAAAHSEQFSRRHGAAAADQARSTHRRPVAGARAFRRRVRATSETQQDLGAGGNIALSPRCCSPRPATASRRSNSPPGRSSMSAGGPIRSRSRNRWSSAPGRASSTTTAASSTARRCSPGSSAGPTCCCSRSTASAMTLSPRSNGLPAAGEAVPAVADGEPGDTRVVTGQDGRQPNIVGHADNRRIRRCDGSAKPKRAELRAKRNRQRFSRYARPARPGSWVILALDEGLGTIKSR
jgi:hypothetical protein